MSPAECSIITLGSRAVDDCTSGFMSVDRMDDLLGNEGSIVPTFDAIQAIFPQVNFTCSGSILSWVFGALWEGNTDSFTELQIWRPGSEDGFYTKVANTTIVTEEIRSKFYPYQLSSPLAFQAGDVLGFYQPATANSQLILLVELQGRGVEHQLEYYYAAESPDRELSISGPGDNRVTVFIDVVTGE